MSARLTTALASLGILALISAAPPAPAPPAPAPRITTPSAAAKTTTPPAAAAAGASDAANDLSQHPELILTDLNPAAVNLYGVKIGDPTTKMPKEKMDRLAGTILGLMKLSDQCALRYNPNTYTVTGLVISNPKIIAKTGLYDRYEAEFKLGWGDIHDEHHMIYLKKHLLLQVNGAEVVGFEIRG